MAHRRLVLSFTLAGLLAFSGPLGCQGSFEDRLAEARELQEQGDFPGSIDRLRELASEQPDQAEVSYRLGVALANTGETSASLWPLRKAAESSEYAVEAGLLLSRLLQQTGNFAEAIVAAQAVLESEPEHEMALSHVARAQILAKRFEEGLVSADRAIAANEGNARGYWLRGAALAELDRPEEAAEAYARMRAVAAESGEISLVVQACSDEGTLRGTKLKQVDRAVALLEECIEQQPGSAGLVRSAAQLLVENDQSPRGEAIWRKSIEAAPELLELRKGLALHLAAEERWDESLEVLEAANADFGTIEASNELAQFHVDRGDHAAAEAVLKSAAERLGDSDALRFVRASLLLDQEDLDGAEVLANTITDPLRKNVIVGRIQYFRGEYEASVKTLETALERWPDNAGVRFILGRAYQALGNYERAIEEYRQAMRAELSGTDAALAAAYLALALGDPVESLQYVLYHVRGRPYRNSEPYVIGARAAALSGNVKAAAELLDHLASQEGGLPAAIAERARIEGEASLETAIENLEEANLDLTSEENQEVLEVKIDLLIRANRESESLELLGRVLAARPGAAVPLALSARVLEASGQEEEARSAAGKALEADPDSARAIAVLARLDVNAGRLDEAIARYDLAAAADERDIESPYRAAQLEYAAGRPDAARERYRELLHRVPAHVGACNDLAYLLAEEGTHLDEALDLAQRAARLSRLPDVIDTLATVRIVRGEEEIAKDLLLQALETNPDSGTLRYRLGVALDKTGDSDGALESFRSALEGGDFPQQAEAQAEIARIESTRSLQ